MLWMLLLDFDETTSKLRAGKRGRKEREDVLSKLRGDCSFLKSNKWAQYIDEMEKINLSVVLWRESWYSSTSVVGYGDDIDDSNPRTLAAQRQRMARDLQVTLHL